MKQLFVILAAVLWLSSLTRPLFAQLPAIEPAPTPAPTDSTRQVRSTADTIPENTGPPDRRRNGIRVGTLPADAALMAVEDTLRVSPKAEARIHKIIPRQATFRSLMLPGLGQAYNRQYYKIPFIYAGFGVMGYLFVKYRGLAKEAASGYRLLLYGRQIAPAQTIRPPASLIPDLLANPDPIKIPAQIEKVEQVTIGNFVYRSTAGAKNAYDTYRRYRDLNIILSLALWGLNAVEANVAAHLRTFDLSDDISMRVEPTVMPMPGTGLVPGVRLALTFK